MIRQVIAIVAILAAGLAGAADDSTAVAHTQRFDMHSDPWINLHHFLYQWARVDEGIATGRRQVEVPERESISVLSETERRSWEQALGFYRESVARLDHFSDEMLAQKRSLRLVGGDMSATPEENIEGIVTVLKAAMPVYLDHWWSEHDASNRRWVADVRSDLEKHENRFVETMARLYGVEWLEDLRRVDVSAYANFAAGYTAFGHVMIFASDPGNQGLYALETIFHEVQHSRFIASPARQAIGDVINREEMTVPSNLWHAFIFATAGEFVRDIAEREGYPAHRPYWTREGFDRLDGWREAYAIVNSKWLAAVAGNADPPTALSEMRDLIGALE